MADFRNCEYTTFVQSGEEYQGRLDVFLDKFYEMNGKKNNFLTNIGLVSIYEVRLTKGRETFVFDSDSRAYQQERSVLKARWIDVSSSSGTKKIEFEVGISDVLITQVIPLASLKKVDDFGGRGAGGKKINLGNQFEEHWVADSEKVLLGDTSRNRYIPKIIELNVKLQKEKKKAFSGVVAEGGANKSRPLVFSGNSLVGAAQGVLTEEMGSTLTDVTFQYGATKDPVYLSLKFGPTLTFFNSGVGGRNGPLLFNADMIKNYKITSAAGKAFFDMFGIDEVKFCESFNNYPRNKPIQNHKVTSTTFNSSAIEKLLRSGIGYGYYMVHHKGSGTNIDIYEIDRSYMQAASRISGGITIYYGGIDGKGKRIDIECESAKYKFKFNIRNKQGGQYPSHVMCDYKKK
jgi:hypothetical protein